MNDDEALLLLMPSIHFGGNWVRWLDHCKDKQRVTRDLIKLLDVTYMRPRFRALCALQACDKQEIENLLTESDLEIDSSLRNLIERYVLTGSMQEYLLKIKTGNDHDLSQKAAAVLREFMRYSEKANGNVSASGLPIM